MISNGGCIRLCDDAPAAGRRGGGPGTPLRGLGGGMRRLDKIGWILFVLGMLLLFALGAPGWERGDGSFGDTPLWSRFGTLAGGACVGVAVLMLIGTTIVQAVGSRPGRLRNGLPSTATVLSTQHTGLVINDVILVFEVELEVAPPGGGASYRARSQVRVASFNAQALSPGSVVAVRVDRRNREKVVVDLDREPGTDNVTALGSAVQHGFELRMTGTPQAPPMSADEILRRGYGARATVTTCLPTGRTVRELGATNPEHPEREQWPGLILALSVRPAEGPPFGTQAVYAVPPELVARVVPGAELPVRFVQHPTSGALVAVDWGSLPRTTVVS